MSYELPFEGLKILDLTQGIAGPSAAMMLAQYGADVIKVEPFEGDWSRHRGAGGDGVSSLSATTNLGKRSIALDLKKPHGGIVLRQLAERADVFMESFRPGVINRLGFGYSEVNSFNPTVVYLSISGFGQKGPLHERPATDAMLQAYSGIMGVNRGPVDDLPHRMPCWPIDVITGVYAFQAVAVALYARRDTKRGRFIDASLLQGAAGLQAIRIVDHVAGGAPDKPASGFPFPLSAFKAADGWVNISVMKDSMWPAFCNIIGLVELGANPSLARAKDRRAIAEELTPLIEKALSKIPSEQLSAQLQSEGILCERVQNYDEMLTHPQTQISGVFTWLDQPGVGRAPFPNVPGPLPLAAGNKRALLPSVGEHSRQILNELGYSDSEIADFISTESVRDASTTGDTIGTTTT
jgi:crotonobetainyl-CoA:carnitine CoA-transferase CaiB-like acyl-CoA transferase